MKVLEKLDSKLLIDSVCGWKKRDAAIHEPIYQYSIILISYYSRRFYIFDLFITICLLARRFRNYACNARNFEITNNLNSIPTKTNEYLEFVDNYRTA